MNAEARQDLDDRGERHEARVLIHNIKGVSGNLAAERIFLLTSELDTALEGEGDIDEALFDRVEEAFGEVTRAIQKLSE